MLRRSALGVVVVTLAAGCGGGGSESTDEGAAPDETSPAATTTATTGGLSSAEARWVASSKIQRVLTKIEADASRYLKKGSIELDIASLRLLDGGMMGGHECHSSLEAARRAPTSRLRNVFKLSIGACAQIERGAAEATPYSLSDAQGIPTSTHEPDPAAARKAMKRARALSRTALSSLEEARAS